MPLCTPPAPSEPPKSRILVPFTGSLNRPLAKAKAIAGLVRLGFFSAAGSVLPEPLCWFAAAAAFAALLTSCSILAIRPCRLSTCLENAIARAPSASISLSIDACWRWRSSISAARRVWSPFRLSRLTARRSRSPVIILRSATSSPRSFASFAARVRNSGTTAPSSIAVRSDCSASSGRTNSAGGGRRPALLVRPEDALQSLRTAMLLGAVVPELRTRAAKLANDLGELVALRKMITGERDRLGVNRDSLKGDQTRLAALIDERQRQQASIERDMEAEGARAI